MSVIKDISILGKPVATIWHKDPCTDGTDDFCGRFKRARHGNPEVLKKIQSGFDFNFKHNYWFDEEGYQKFSTIGLMVEMYRAALWVHFNYSRRKSDRFMRKHLHSIIYLAENPHDCIGESIRNKYLLEGRELENERRRLASVIYGDILRKDRKWWQSPKLHIHHWRITSPLFRKKKSGGYVDDNLRATV